MLCYCTVLMSSVPGFTTVQNEVQDIRTKRVQDIRHWKVTWSKAPAARHRHVHPSVVARCVTETVTKSKGAKVAVRVTFAAGGAKSKCERHSRVGARSRSASDILGWEHEVEVARRKIRGETDTVELFVEKHTAIAQRKYRGELNRVSQSVKTRCETKFANMCFTS